MVKKEFQREIRQETGRTNKDTAANVKKLRNATGMFVACLAVSFVFAACGKESGKQITAFSFANPSAVGVINESAKTIAVAVPSGTDVTALVPAITVSEKAKVSPASGVAQDFTNPVTYTVTAEDGSTAAYTVRVTKGTGGDDGGDTFIIDAKNVVNGSAKIVTVKATVLGEYDDYIVASSEYKNNAFKLTLSTVPSRYLYDFMFGGNGVVLSDENAKMAYLDVFALDNTMKPIGYFFLDDASGGENATDYFYVDRNFTAKGTYVNDDEIWQVDCTFKKGWNTVYWVGTSLTTTKPSGINFKWVYYNSWIEEDYSLANQKSNRKSRFPMMMQKRKR
jgi:hypothetical protein